MFSLRQYVNENKGALGFYLLIALINSAVAFLLPVSIGEFFRITYHTEGSKGKLLHLLGIHMESLGTFFLFFICLILIRAAAEFFEKYLAARQGELLVRGLRDEIFETQLSWDTEKFRKKHFGNYLLRYSNDMKAIQNFLTRGWLGGCRELIFLMMGFSVLFIINKPLTLLYEGLFLAVVVLFFFISARQRSLIISSRDKRSSLLAFVTRSFQEHRQIREQGRKEKVMDKFNQRSGQLFDANMGNNRFESVLQSLLPLFQYAMIGGVLLAVTQHGIFRVHAGDALVFVLIMLQMNGALKRLLKVMPAINKGKISLKKIHDIISGDTDSPASGKLHLPETGKQ